MAGQVQQGATHAAQYEVRCERCRTSFPLGTRRCVHCGGRLGRQPGMEIPGRPDALGEEDGSPGPPRVVRGLIWGVSLAIALVGSLFRACEGG